MTPRPFGEPLAQAVRHYLNENNLTQRHLTGEILADIGQRFYEHFQAQQKTRKKKGDATPEEIAIYEAYPKKVGRLDALNAIREALGNVSHDRLLERVGRYASCVARWPISYRFKEGRDTVPNPSTWFNQGRYEDDPKEWLPAGMFQRDDDPRGSPALSQGRTPDSPLVEPKGWKAEFPDSIYPDWAAMPQDSKRHICTEMKRLYNDFNAQP